MLRYARSSGFPLGAMSTKAKTVEAIEAVKDGADEIDMVMNIGELKAGNDEAVLARSCGCY